MKIALGTDHAGFRYKEQIKAYLMDKGHEVQDFGTHDDNSCDYPDFIHPVAQAVAAWQYERGIVLGGSGNGEAIAANKTPGIRCALCWDTRSAELSRQHNDANMLSLGERMIPEDQLLQIVQIWLETPFEGGRHIARIEKIETPTRPG